MGRADRSLAIGYLLRGHGILVEDARAVVDGYVRRCSVLVSMRDLAVMAVTLANRGVNPLSGERVVPEGVVRQVLSVMLSCGMYDAAGDWGTQVGIPAKSGVAGGLIGALPGQVGMAAFSPRLDGHGNSVRGVSLFERFSSDMGLHVMGVPAAARAVLRAGRVVGVGRVRCVYFSCRAVSDSRGRRGLSGRPWAPGMRSPGWLWTLRGFIRSTTWPGGCFWRLCVG
ncbi:glutaminase [Streptomyces sp. CAI 127]|uniref:glutaminase n=1 Tax=Streptomyces sp. CAI 127 TaxID=1076397 RepID=UPI0028157327|nr:glutaminase [Streptomyces sp. CAI 127]